MQGGLIASGPALLRDWLGHRDSPIRIFIVLYFTDPALPIESST